MEFIGLIITATCVIGSILMVRSAFKKAISGFLFGGATKMLGASEVADEVKSKVKNFVKKPLDNPEVEQNDGERKVPMVSPSQARQIPMFFGNANQLPNNLEKTGTSSSPVRSTGVVGEISPSLAIVQRGINTNKVKRPQITGPVMQSGMILNRKFRNIGNQNQNTLLGENKARKIGNVNQNTLLGANKARKIGNLNQLTGNALNNGLVIGNINQVTPTAFNTARRIGRYTNNGMTQITGAKGRMVFKSNKGSVSYLDGNINNPMFDKGIINVEGRQIKGFSRVETMIGKKFTSSRGKIAHPRRNILGAGNKDDLQGQIPAILINGGPNIGVALNDSFLQRNNQYNMQSQRWYLGQNQQLNMLGLTSVYTDPRNKNLNLEQKVKFYAVNRLREQDKLITSGNEGFWNEKNRENDDWYRLALQNIPGVDARTIIRIVERAKNLRRLNDRADQMVALKRTEVLYGSDNDLKRNTLNDILKQTAVASTFHDYVQNKFESENMGTLNDSQIKQLEEKARAIVQEREGLSEEEKEEQFKQEIEEQKEKYKQENMETLEEIAKEEIINDPDKAKEIFGEEAAEELEKKVKKRKKLRKDKYEEFKKRQENVKDSNYKKEHPEAEGYSAQKLTNERIKYENGQFINNAANELVRDGSNFQALPNLFERRNNQNQPNIQMTRTIS